MVDLDKFVEQCNAALDSTHPANTVETLVLEAIAEPQSLRAAATRSNAPDVACGIRAAWPAKSSTSSDRTKYTRALTDGS